MTSNEKFSNPEPYQSIKKNKETHQLKCLKPGNICLLLGGFFVILSLLIHHFDFISMSLGQKSQEEKTNNTYSKRIYAIHGKNVNDGHLRHVFEVLEKLGYSQGSIDDDWTLLWAHDYPFKQLSFLKNLKPYQKVNHFPGSGHITNKLELATMGTVKQVPIAFKIPRDKDKFLDYAKRNKDKQFVQKKNSHRGIKILQIDQIDLNNNQSFIQEYISKPFLIDGYKFDIGVYTILTSIDPLRLYIFDGDILFRFCPQKYHPFDPEIVDKYVIGDDYLPTWEVPSLKKYYIDLGFSMKESFNAYVRTLGKDPNIIWDKIEEVIRAIYLEKESLFLQTLSNYPSKNNFFEMVRIDFIIDEDLNVYLMEANMSPNLSSAHFAPNRLLYEQVLFNLFGLVGIGSRIKGTTFWDRVKNPNGMDVGLKNIVVSPETCAKQRCKSCISPECHLCKFCLTPESIFELESTFLEHVNRGICKRIFPPIMYNQSEAKKPKIWENYSPENQLVYRWFQEKCLLDQHWCN